MHNTRNYASRSAAFALLSVVAAACTTVAPPPAPPPQAAEIPVPVFKRAPAPERYSSMEQYQAAVAKRIFDANPGKTINGDLKPLLRAIVVLQFNVDAHGRVHNVRTWRTPEHEADRIARASLHRAEALPPPPHSWLQGGMVEVTETWLIDREGRFHLRALKPRQL